MRPISCTRCGSSELTERDGYATCDYCQSKYALDTADALARCTTIGVMSDVEALLQKCIDDPHNRRLYANLVLDIDPTNLDALKYLR
jgi:DNA-directed RNA polymerase subunit RPC12/RpoP